MRAIILILLLAFATAGMAQVTEEEKKEREREEQREQERLEKRKREHLRKERKARERNLEKQNEQNEAQDPEAKPVVVMDFGQLVDSFRINYKKLAVPEIQPDYVQTLLQVKNDATLNAFNRFYNKYSQQLKNISRANLNNAEKIDYDIINRLLNQVKTYTDLRSAMINNGEEVAPGGLSQLKRGGDWYQFFFKHYNGGKFTDLRKLKAYADSKIKIFQREIERQMDELGYESKEDFYKNITGQIYYIKDRDKLLKQAREKVDNVLITASSLYGVDLPSLEVKLSDQPAHLDAENKTLNLHLPQNGYPVKDLDYDIIKWVAGHYLLAQLPESKAQLADLINTTGFEDAWALHTTTKGKRFQLYRDPINKLGEPMNKKRLAVISRIDVGIHLDGWSEEQAVKYWNESLPWNPSGKEMVKEIMKKPAYYSVAPWNGFQIDNKRINAPVTWGSKIPPEEYYQMLLSHGNLPIDMIFERVEQAVKE